MDAYFTRFLRRQISLAPLGVEVRTENTPYFCTPKGAFIFGWAGVDGIHYCFVRGHGGMVFAVNPSEEWGKYVHPIAASFRDFLRLLLACGDACYLEQAWRWDRVRFDAEVARGWEAQRKKEDACQALTAIAAWDSLTPLEDPYAYLQSLQASFDSNLLRYSSEYDALAPATAAEPVWAVYADGGFYTSAKKKEKPGRALAVEKRFTWNDGEWRIPAMYLCGSRLVMDLICYTSPEMLFDQSRKKPEEMDVISLQAELCMEDHRYHCIQYSSVSYDPASPGSPDAVTEMVRQHYDLPSAEGWRVFRMTFRRETKKRTLPSAMTLTLTPEPSDIPGPLFSGKEGETVSFAYPPDGRTYTLTVLETKVRKLPFVSSGNVQKAAACYCTELTYRMEPAIPQTACSVRAEPSEREVRGETSIGHGAFSASDKTGDFVFQSAVVIGSGDGPLMLFGGQTAEENGERQSVLSPVRYVPEAYMDWRIFYHFQKPSLSVSLLLKDGGQTE